MPRTSLWMVCVVLHLFHPRPSVPPTSAALHVANEWTRSQLQFSKEGTDYCYLKWRSVSSNFTSSCMQIIIDQMLNLQVSHRFLITNLFVGSMFLRGQTSDLFLILKKTLVFSFNSRLFVLTVSLLSTHKCLESLAAAFQRPCDVAGG